MLVKQGIAAVNVGPYSSAILLNQVDAKPFFTNFFLGIQIEFLCLKIMQPDSMPFEQLFGRISSNVGAPYETINFVEMFKTKFQVFKALKVIITICIF